jgi:hypothetical protein
MMRTVGLMMACVLASAAGCRGSDQRTLGRFDGYGDIDKQPLATPRVATAEDIKVFYGTAPEGFSLRDNELKVEGGFDHQILGTIVVQWNEDGKRCDWPPLFTKRDVIAQMRVSAHQQGGTAVIYAHSAIPDSPDPDAICSGIAENKASLGNGWVVVLGGPTKAPAAAPAAPAAPTAPVAPAAPEAPTAPPAAN